MKEVDRMGSDELWTLELSVELGMLEDEMLRRMPSSLLTRYQARSLVLQVRDKMR